MVSVLSLLTLRGFAQTPAVAPVHAEREVRVLPTTEVDFEKALEIEGELLKPAGTLVVTQRRTVFPPLFHLRENWDVEMVQSVDSIR